MPINTSTDRATELASLLGCSLGSMPFTYLGLPMGTTRPAVSDFLPLITSVERKLSVAASLLDYGSKLTLVNSVVSSLAVYTMCSLKLPPKVIDHLDRIRRHCIWSKTGEFGTKSCPLVAWSLLCRPK